MTETYEAIPHNEAKRLLADTLDDLRRRYDRMSAAELGVMALDSLIIRGYSLARKTRPGAAELPDRAAARWPEDSTCTSATTAARGTSGTTTRPEEEV